MRVSQLPIPAMNRALRLICKDFLPLSAEGGFLDTPSRPAGRFQVIHSHAHYVGLYQTSKGARVLLDYAIDAEKRGGKFEGQFLARSFVEAIGLAVREEVNGPTRLFVLDVFGQTAPRCGYNVLAAFAMLHLGKKLPEVAGALFDERLHEWLWGCITKNAIALPPTDARVPSSVYLKELVLFEGSVIKCKEPNPAVIAELGLLDS